MDLLNVPAATTSDSNTKVLMLDGSTLKSRTVSGLSLGSIPDGDKGDITTSSSGATWTIDNTAVTYAKIQNVSATSRILGRKTASAGSTEECTLSEVLDFVGSATRGDILYRGASSWTRLAAGTSGQYLKTQGTTGDPVWATVSSTGSQRADLAFSAPSLAQSPSIPAYNSGTNPYPFLGANQYATRYKLNFVPTNYQISIIIYTEIDSAVVTSAVGLALEKSTDGSSWSNVYNWDLRDIDGWTSTSGSVSFTGTPSNTFFRFNYYNAGYNDAVSFQHFNLVLSLWN